MLFTIINIIETTVLAIGTNPKDIYKLGATEKEERERIISQLKILAEVYEVIANTMTVCCKARKINLDTLDWERPVSWKPDKGEYKFMGFERCPICCDINDEKNWSVVYINSEGDLY
jgi:hypothetical protein